MKICIVTLYKTTNSGSFLQAYALKKYFELLGHDAYLLRINYTLKNRMKKILKYPSHFIKYGYSEFKLLYKTNMKFKKMQQSLNLISNKTAMNIIDIFVFGSDTIWNIDSSNIFKLRKIFFGTNFINKRKISYAASFANTKYNTVARNKDIIKSLSGFRYISVRDEHSATIIQKLFNNTPKIVCDPTILLEKDDYNQLLNCIKEPKFIFAYLFDDLNDQNKKEIIKFARNNELKIICGTKKYSWCDERVSNSPDSFITHISNAEYVITDTFHGTVFSTIFNKKFIVIDRNKEKVNDFLNKHSLKERLINGQILGDIWDKRINYEYVNSLLQNDRKNSKIFIEESLNK